MIQEELDVPASSMKRIPGCNYEWWYSEKTADQGIPGPLSGS